MQSFPRADDDYPSSNLMKQGDFRMKTGRTMPICRYLLLLLLLAGMIVGCGGSDSDESAPLLTFAGTDPSTTVRSHQLAGTVEDGAVVQVTVNTAAVVNALLVADGLWSCSIDDLAPGSNLVTILATDSTGNQSVLLLSLLYDPVSIERWVTPIPGDTVTIGGLVDSAAAGSIEAIVEPVASVSAPVVNGDHWEIVVSGLAAGNNLVKVTINHPDADVALVERTVTITVNELAPVVTIDPVVSPTDLDSQVAAGTRDDDLTLTLLAPTAVVEGLNLNTVGIWSATLTTLQQGKNPFTASVTLNGVTATARDLIIFDPTP
jgi:hypothetical protein